MPVPCSDRIEFLQNRNEINPQHIGLIGYSEGGLIASTVASRTEDVSFLVIMAGPILPGKENSSLVFTLLVNEDKARIQNFDKDKKTFDKVIRIGMILVGVCYVIMQAIWISSFKEGMFFQYSYLQLIFACFFLIMLLFSLYYLIKFRTSYRMRLVLAFTSIVIAQLVNMYGSILHEIPGYLKIIRAAAPILVPTMFGSVVFKELFYFL